MNSNQKDPNVKDFDLTIHEFIQTLVESETKTPFNEFFKIIYEKFYSDKDISFMNYFLRLTEYEGKFVIHHEKLIEYGIITSTQTAHVKETLDALGLVEDKEYHGLQTRGFEWLPEKFYMLTPEAFKKCLMKAQPVVYCEYYLLLEKIYKLYFNYEDRVLTKHKQECLQKEKLLEQNNHVNTFFKNLQFCNIDIDHINDEITFTSVDGVKILMYHKQSGCENVEFVSFENLPHLLCEKILEVDLAFSCDLLDKEIETRKDLTTRLEEAEEWYWTIYTFKTQKGEAKIVWLSTVDGHCNDGDVELKYIRQDE